MVFVREKLYVVGIRESEALYECLGVHKPPQTCGIERGLFFFPFHCPGPLAGRTLTFHPCVDHLTVARLLRPATTPPR